MKKILNAILLLSSSFAYGGSQMGTVDYIIVRASDGLTYFTLKGGELKSRPSCARIGYWMIRDENSTAGKNQLAILLSAQASGKTIQVQGMNSCERWGDGEDVNFIKIQ